VELGKEGNNVEKKYYHYNGAGVVRGAVGSSQLCEAGLAALVSCRLDEGQGGYYIACVEKLVRGN
jgi:hypothetical protein